MKFPRRVRYLVLFVLCAMYFIAYVDRVNISVAGPFIRKEFALTPTELGLAFSVFAYPYTVMQVLGGWLSDRLGPRRVLAGLSFLWALGTVLTGFSFGLYALVAARLVVGLGEGGAFPAATRALAHWMPVRERGFAQGITHSFSRLGGAVTPPLVLFVAKASGWRSSFVLLGVVSLGWTLLWLLVFTDRPSDHAWVLPSERAELSEASTTGPTGSRMTPWRAIVRGMWLVTFVDFCYGWSLWVFLTWLPTYLVEGRGFRQTQMAATVGLTLLVGGVGDTLGGVASDALYKRTGNLRLARRSVLILGLVGAAVFVVPAVLVPNHVAVAYDLALAFFFLELTNAVLWTLPLDIAGAFAGTAGGFMNTGFGVAGMISPVIFGYAIQCTGSYRLPFFLSAGLLLVGALAASAIDPERSRSEGGVERVVDIAGGAHGE